MRRVNVQKAGRPEELSSTGQSLIMGIFILIIVFIINIIRHVIISPCQSHLHPVGHEDIQRKEEVGPE